MPTTRDEISNYLDELLQLHAFQDYCPNGLQVEGCSEIKTIVTGVTANQALIEAAIEHNAEAIVVHHGYFWKGENPCFIGMKKRRMQLLLQHEMNLLAYHLPLDAHSVYGNNVQLAEVLNLSVKGPLSHNNVTSLVFNGTLPESMSGQQLCDHIHKCLGRKPMHIASNKSQINSIAWCTGAAQNYIDQAISANVDAFITGEISEQTVHAAKENNLHFYAAGHHATERYGVKALGEHLAQEFNIKHFFIDIDNPV